MSIEMIQYRIERLQTEMDDTSDPDQIDSIMMKILDLTDELVLEVEAEMDDVEKLMGMGLESW